MGNLGRWLFLAGLIICIVVGLGLANNPYVPAALAILGVIVGFLNVGAGESSRFLLASIALVICASSLNAIPYIGQHVSSIAGYLVAFIAAAVVVVAVKSLLETAGD
ncbi:MAG: hypothetical protein AAF304_07740 [Pseudomonadota bacterium]